MMSCQIQSQDLDTTRDMFGETLCDYSPHAMRLSLDLNVLYVDKQRSVLLFLPPKGMR